MCDKGHYHIYKELSMANGHADAERFMNWRTIDGKDLDPLGQFNELETQVRGVMATSHYRVNRVFKDKQGGLVVDYIGIANELKAALKEYTGSNGKCRGVLIST